MLGSGWLNRCRETLRVAGWGGVGGGKEGWGGGGWKPCSLVGRDITGTSMRARTRRELAAATDRAQELCESRGGRRGLPVPNKPTVSVDVKQL